ncbi:MAG: hypothetical protein H6766_07200 [Candidatus Peribacteria bacterium]|nr:MAG: hypothetical protein H6766_07200 [Candidatus Peribacteria bacterium]
MNTIAQNPTNDLHQTLNNPLFQAVEQVGNLLSVSKKSPSKAAQITPEVHEYEKIIIKKRGSTPHR